MEDKSQKNTINTLYLFLVLSTILGFTPNGTAFLMSLALWVTVLIAAYYYRSKDTEDGLLYNHMTYLIGTVWIGTSVIVLGALVGGFWIYTQGNSSAIDTFTANIGGGFVPTEADMMSVKDQYVADNKQLIITASLFTVGPAILYFVYRVANGLSRAGKGYRIANPKSWL